MDMLVMYRVVMTTNKLSSIFTVINMVAYTVMWMTLHTPTLALSEKLSEQYAKLADYIGDNKLVINDDKTHLLVMGGPTFQAVSQYWHSYN